MAPRPASRRRSVPDPSGGGPSDAGPPVEVLAQVLVRPDGDLDAFEAALADSPAVLSAWQSTGEADYVAHLACRSLPDVEAELRRVREHPAVRRVTAQLLLHRVRAAGRAGPADQARPASPAGSEQA
ncbi:Lrp/AsnC ligand binding domain-containing protein [Promicromonospora sukumoe]|uniref:Lrp/AsnC ligand binding domain-containing protein n=1 Tax=Promicromonospora sukumoe TaxID=88382 RepID=UPI00366336AA